jgi:hypothetical protein
MQLRSARQSDQRASAHQCVVDRSVTLLCGGETFTDLKWFADLPKWEGLQSVGVVQATRKLGSCLFAPFDWNLDAFALQF